MKNSRKMEAARSRLRRYLPKLAQVLSGKFDVTVKVEGDKYARKGNTIWIPALSDEATQEYFELLQGALDHEIGHILFSPHPSMSETALERWSEEDPAQAYWQRLFCTELEEKRVEEKMCQIYPGCRRHMVRSWGITAGEKKETYEEEEPDWANQLHDGFLASRYPVFEQFSTYWEDGVEEVLEVVLPFMDGVADLESEEVLERAEQMWEAAKDLLPDPPEQEEVPEGMLPFMVIPGEEDPDSEGGSAMPLPGGLETVVSAMINQAAEEDTGHRPVSITEGTVETPEIESFDGPSRVESGQVASLNEFREGLKYSAGLRSRLLRHLLGSKRSHWAHGQRAGRIDPGKLHQAVTGTNQRVFRSRSIEAPARSACTLLLDESGSMSRQMIVLVGQLALLFGEALSKMQFPLEIIGFTTHSTQSNTGLLFTIYKSFADSWQVGRRRLGSLSAQGYTPMGEALRFSARRILEQEESRRILFCLTDGKPEGGSRARRGNCSDIEFAKDSVRLLEEAGIEPVGIGIQEATVSNIFNKWAVAESLDTLLGKFVNQLSEALIGRSIHKED